MSVAFNLDGAMELTIVKFNDLYSYKTLEAKVTRYLRSHVLTFITRQDHHIHYSDP